MSHVTKKFNAKARQSTAGSHKKSSHKRDRDAKIEVNDPNASILVPKTKEQKEQEHKEKLRQEVCASSTILCVPQYDCG